ncbi:MAG: ATP-grasp domain-containing protein [Butyrivibrio sp.]|uniref:ATP-grasp domain-containing protein n=1 Tax=Butyrivibrio sp. TaxID=28121 RepID=UPI0025CC5A3B|nr:ATP-grasp domain-containing protein [Butyrivibrio sp.]MCR5770691.1 ATP-grasp domain-containing protein [Butyrivibrio sp.]
MKKVLIPNGSFHDIPLIKKAKEYGYYVITSGTAPEGLGHRYADEYVYGDFSIPDKMLEIAQSKNIDKVCSNCNDFGYLSACYVAEKMQLGGHERYEDALTLHHKDLFKKLSKKLKISSPVAIDFDCETDANRYLLQAQYPIIVKPVDLGAGQGIRRANTQSEGRYAVRDAFYKSKCKKIVIEPFITGSNHSFNAFLVNGKVRGYYSDNEYMHYSKYRVSTSGGPADFIEDVVDTLISDTETVAEALSIKDGLMHSQYILDREHKPHILEITRRMSGDWYPYPEIKATGIDWVDYIFRTQCADNVSDFPNNIRQKGYTGRHCLNGHKKGKIKNIRFDSDLEKYIYDSVMWLGKGYEIKNTEKDYPGIIFFDFDDREKMIYIVEHIDMFVELIYE